MAFNLPEVVLDGSANTTGIRLPEIVLDGSENAQGLRLPLIVLTDAGASELALVASGGAVAAGDAIVAAFLNGAWEALVLTATGGASVGGSASIVSVNVRRWEEYPLGGARVSGSATVGSDWTQTIASGGARVSGTATVTSSSITLLQFSMTGSGGAELDGEAAVVFDSDYVTGDGGARVAGSALVRFITECLADSSAAVAVDIIPGHYSWPVISEVLSVLSSCTSPELLFVEVNSALTADAGATAYRLFVLDAQSAVSADGTAPVVASYAVSAESFASLLTGTQFVFDFTEGWAYNLNTGAASFYEGMKFNSFAMIGGQYYGCSESGIYLLNSDKDNGEDIHGTVTLGLSRLESDATKTVPLVYVGAKSAEPIRLTCRVEGEEYCYEFSRETAQMEPARLKPGKGLKGVYWQFELSNQNGADMDIDLLEVVTAPTSRKV